VHVVNGTRDKRHRLSNLNQILSFVIQSDQNSPLRIRANTLVVSCIRPHFARLFVKQPEMKSIVHIAALGTLLGFKNHVWAFQSRLPQWQSENAALSSAFMASVTDDASLASATITTGPDGRAAMNFEEDLRLTLQIIMDHERRSTTASKEQFVQQVAAAAALETEDVTVDISVPYDAAARLAYSKEESNLPYEEFKLQYEAKAVGDVRAKKTPSVGTPKEEVTAANEDSPSTFDVSIPYDSAAKLAYERLNSIKHKLSYDQFKVQYENNAVTNVIMKKNKRTNIE
jgi:hypothetical protein